MRLTIALGLTASICLALGGGIILSRSATAAPRTHDARRDAARVPVRGETFVMGSADGPNDERPLHRVDLAPFELDRYEVTNSRYGACVKVGRCKPPALPSSKTRASYFGNPEFDEYPVIHVSWQQAAEFCSFAGGRLPSEAEWERAAKGSGTPRTYPWGDEPPDCTRANMTGCVGDTDKVGAREAGRSPVGADDMAGNVWEWTQDWYDASYYEHSPEAQPVGPSTGTLKVMRGGCWVSDASSLRTTCRKAELPDTWAPNVGFRCAYPKEGE
jgi:formylglycine-generating enzyme required for sulfatase activity